MYNIITEQTTTEGILREYHFIFMYFVLIILNNYFVALIIYITAHSIINHKENDKN